MPLIKIEGIGRAKFPDEMGRDEIEAAIQLRFGKRLEEIRRQKREAEFQQAQAAAQKTADEQGIWDSFTEGMGRAKDDFILGKTLLELDHADAQELLEKEYQKWKTTPKADEADLLSWRGIGNLAGEAGVTIGPTIGAGLGAGALTTPLGGLVAAGTTATGIQATSAKGATFRNDYINLRHQQEMDGKNDPSAAYETARDTSNKAAMIAGGIAAASTAIPVGKFIKPGSTVSSTVAKKVGGEIAFDTGLGAAESISSDVYAEAQGVDRGDILENALRSAAGEALIGGPFSVFHGRGYLKEARQQRAQDWVDARMQPPTQRALPAPPAPVGLLPHNPAGWQLPYTPMKQLPGPDGPIPMIMDGPIIDVETGKVLDVSLEPDAPIALLDEHGNVINLKGENDAGRTAALEIEAKFEERISNKRTDPEGGKLGFRRTAEDFIDTKPREPDVDAPVPVAPRELTPTTKPEPPTTRTFQEGHDAVFGEKHPWQFTKTEFEQGVDVEDSRGFPIAGKTVSGLSVREHVPNTDSISATYENYKILEGIREVFIPNPKQGTRGELAEEIGTSKEINPLIVGVDETGVSIIEGSHRIDALQELGVASFPAVVVIDTDAHAASVKQAIKEGKPVPEKVKREYPDAPHERPSSPEPKVDKGQQLLSEFKEAVNELGGRVGMGVDPIATWKVFKSLVKMAAYQAARGVKSAAQFAKRIGVKLTEAVKQAWADGSTGVARTPAEIPQATVDDISGRGKPSRETATRRTLGQIVSDHIDAAKRRLELDDTDSKANEVIRKLVDRFVDLKILQRLITAGKKIPDTMNAYLHMELLSDRVGAALTKLRSDVLDPMLSRMKELGLSDTDLHIYLHARHAEEANKRIAEIRDDMPDGGSGMTNEDAEKHLARFQREGKLPALQEIEKTVRALTQSKLDLELEGGLIDEANHQRLSTYYERYVPLNREGEHSDHIESGNSTFKGHKKRVGSGKDVVDITSNLFAQYSNAIEQVERNRAMAALEQLIQKYPTEVISRAKPKIVPDFGPDGKLTSRVDPLWKSADNIISYWIAGEQRFFQVNNPALARNLKNMGYGSTNAFIRAFGAGNRFLALVNTQLAPSFVIPNFLRDLQTARINIAAEDAEALRANILRSVPKAFRAAWKAEVGVKGKKSYEGVEGQYYKEFTEIGGKIEFFGLKDIEAYKKRIQQGLKDQSKPEKAIRFLIDKASSLNATVENTMRLSVYANAREAGLSKMQAASLAKNITVNFSRKGEWSSGLNSWFLFFNAGVQGSYRMAQAIQSPKVQKAVGGIAAFAVAQDLLNHMISDEDEDGESFYNKIPEHVRERNMVVMSPFGGKDYLKIPMPYGYNVFHYAGTNLSRFLRGTTSVGETVAHTLNSTLNAFNPIGGASDLFSMAGLARAATPDIFNPLVELPSNKDWKDDPIYPDQNPFDKYEKPWAQRYFSSVSAPSKFIADKLNRLTGGTDLQSGLVDLNPEALDHLFSHFFGGMGKDALRPFTGKGVDKLPVVQRFVGGQTIYYDQENYYKLRGEAYQADDQIKSYKASGEVLKLKTYLEEAAPLRKVLPRIKDTDKKIRNLNQKIRVLEASANIDDNQKAERVEKLKEQKIQLMKLARKRFLILTGNE